MAEPAGPASVRMSRRSDPDRRERIIGAALDVIAEAGVAGASHRKIAAAAGVPLGSMTYHFDGMDELLREAFTRFAEGIAANFEQRMAESADQADAKAAVIAIITEDVFGTRRELVLTHELYTLAAREARFRDITNAWMSRSRRALEKHFDPLTARLIDALIEGLTIHRALDKQPHDQGAAIEAMHRLTRP